MSRACRIQKVHSTALNPLVSSLFVPECPSRIETACTTRREVNCEKSNAGQHDWGEDKYNRVPRIDAE